MSAPQLLALNPKITDNKIRAGQSLSLANQAAHKVARGDTLYSIAAKNKMTVEALRKLNGLSGDTLKIGQTLKLR